MTILIEGQYDPSPVASPGKTQRACAVDNFGRLIVTTSGGGGPASSVEITDGTSTAGVTPASTAATAAQPALVVASSPNSPTPVTPDRVVTATPAALGTVEIDCAGLGVVGIFIVGAFTGSMSFQYFDGTAWNTANAYPIELGNLSSVTTAPGGWRVDVSGFVRFRVNVTALTVGTPTVRLEGTATASIVKCVQGPPSNAGSPWFQAITDGANGTANVSSTYKTNGETLTLQTVALQVSSVQKLFNGVTWDPWTGASKVGSGDVVEQQMPAAEDSTNGVIATVIKPLAANTYAPSRTQVSGSAGANVKATAGNLRSIQASSRNAAALVYFQIWDTATTPGTGTIVYERAINPATVALPVTTVSAGGDMFSLNGIACATGIAFGFSSTTGTYSAAATAANYDVFITYA